MKKFAVETIGCRLNQYETEKMADQLIRMGLERVAYNEPADLYLVNTCTVTGRADASCRNIISRAARRNNDAAIVVAGCYVDADADKVAHLNGVNLVVKNCDKDNIAKIVSEHFPHLVNGNKDLPTPAILPAFHQHNRAWIKISDGCNQHCAYCIIPHVRGKLNNRPAGEIIDEINLLSSNGYHEVVLTGVHIGQYRDGHIDSIAELIQYILENTSISRIRFSSIEPQEVNSSLIEVMKNGEKRICRHLHVPLQSGSDRILGLMRRPYRVRNYIDNIRAARDSIENIVIGADIIVGFPGETEADFAESVRVAETGIIDYLHVFSYSDRPGTESAQMPVKINSEVIKERNKILRDISDRNYETALKRQIGSVAHAISEYGTDESGRYYWAITDNYLKVILPENCGGGREIISLKINDSTESHLIGSI